MRVSGGTRVGTTDGAFSGTITAKSASGGSVRSTFGAVREAESYELTLKTVGRNGKPTAPTSTSTTRTHVPKGRYLVSTQLTRSMDTAEEEFKSLDSSGPLVKGAIEKGDVDVANLFTADTDIKDNDWVVLSDPKDLIQGSRSSPSSPTARPTPPSARPSPGSATSSPPPTSPSSTARWTATRSTRRTWPTRTRSSTGWRGSEVRSQWEPPS